MRQLPCLTRVTITLLSLFWICATLSSQDHRRDLWEEQKDYFGTSGPYLDRLFAARHPDKNLPKEGARPYRIEVAFYRESKPMRSGFHKLDWTRGSAQMKKLSQSPPKSLLHHQGLRLLEGQTGTFGDLKTKSFFVDTNIEVGGGASAGPTPVVRSLREGLSLCLRLQPGTNGLPARLDLDLAWQKFPDKVKKMVVGLDLLPSLDEFRSDFFRIQGSLALGKQQAWLYRPGGTKLPKLAILILVEALATHTTVSPTATPPISPRPAWMIRIGKEQWTSKRAWAPVGEPLVIPSLDGLPTTIQEGAALSYLSDINVEVGLSRVLADPQIDVFQSGLRATLAIQTLGDRLWVQLKLRDRTLNSMREVPLEATLNGILKAPVFRSRIFSRSLLLAPGERLPLGSGAGMHVGDKTRRTRLWLQVDPLRVPR